MSEQTLVSIIIVNYNGCHLLKDCLSSLKEANFSNYEIILVDNNSTDDSIQFVKSNYPSITIIKLDKNYGFAKPNNVGAKKAKGDFLLFLNNDTKVTANFISELYDAINRDSTVAICQSLLLKPNGDVDSSGDYIDSIGISFSSHNRPDKIIEIFSAKSASMLMRKDVFEKLNGFDEKFFAIFEDVDLGWRARILGYKIILCPNSIVYHVGGQTIKNINKLLTFHGIKNQLMMKITNFEFVYMLKSLFMFFTIYGVKSFRVWLDYRTKGYTHITSTKYEDKIFNKPDFKSTIKGIFWILQNLPYVLKKRRLVNSTRKVNSKNLIKLI